MKAGGGKGFPMSKINDLAVELKNLLGTGAYPSGARFPSEYELMERFQVSRLTANKAVALLVAEGLLDRGRRGSGTFVRRARKFPRGWLAAIEDFNHPYNMGMIAGAAETAFADGYMLSVFRPDRQVGISMILRQLAVSDCLGVLVSAYGVGVLPSDFPKPVIYLDYGVEEHTGRLLHSVVCDNYGAAYEMMTRIIAAGKREIVVLGIESTPNRRQRIAGFTAAMQEHRLTDIARRRVIMHHGSRYEVKIALQKILRQFPKADFIATDSDDIVYRIMDVAREKTFGRLEKIGLSGFGNVQGIADLHHIPSVNQHPWHIGKEAVNALLEMIRNGEPEESLRIQVPAELVNTEYL